MTPAEAHIHNAAINAAIAAYRDGIGAIVALKVKHAVVVDHVGRGTNQDVVDVGQ